MAFLRVERQARQASTRTIFHGRKTPREFGVGIAQGAFGVDAKVARIIDHRQQQVADLFVAFGIGRRGRDLGEFLGNLVARPIGVGPVETDTRCAALQLLRAE